jgi:hypothetical protein
MNPNALRVSLAVGSLVLSSIAGCSSSSIPIGSDPLDASGAREAGMPGADATAPVDAPHSEAAAPVYERLLFIVEITASAIVDPAKSRVAAVNQIIEKHAGDANIHLGVLAFSESVVNATRVFTAAADLPAIDSAISQSGTDADYEGALSAAATLIDEDAKALPAATRALTHYVVVFMGGAPPQPVCTVASTTCGSSTCPTEYYCSAGACVPDPLICTLPRSSWGSALSPPVPSSDFPNLVPGKDFNTLSAIEGKIQSITALQAADQIGSIELDTVLVWAPSDGGAVTVPGVGRREDAVALLTEMAMTGGGSYIDLTATPTLPF